MRTRTRNTLMGHYSEAHIDPRSDFRCGGSHVLVFQAVAMLFPARGSMEPKAVAAFSWPTGARKRFRSQVPTRLWEGLLSAEVSLPAIIVNIVTAGVQEV